MHTQFQKLNEILDNEIKAYTKLKAFFEEKRDSLKNSKPDDLGVLDNMIYGIRITWIQGKNIQLMLILMKIITGVFRCLLITVLQTRMETFWEHVVSELI